MSKHDLKQVVLWAALTVVILTPAGLLAAWAGWPYGLIYALGAGLAAVLAWALTNNRRQG